MGLYSATPISIKKYIKIPARRLISGFLHINVVNHSDNDNKKDAYEKYRTDYVAGSLDADQYSAEPFGGTSSGSFADVSRSSKKLSFGDQDCLLYWVSGGMSLQNPIFTGSAKNSLELSIGGYGDTTSGVWYEGITDYCQNFIKYDLISRMNYGYGHGALNSSEDFKGTIAITKNEFRSDETGVSGHDSTVTPPDYDTTGGESPNAHGGNFQKHIVSCGSYSNSGDGPINFSTGSSNSFWPPVQDVEVYGTHRLSIRSQTNGSTPLYSIATSEGGYHLTDFWNLVIDIKMRGYDDGWTSGSPSQADTEWYKSRTNIFFQPFGETASFDISDSEHTS